MPRNSPRLKILTLPTSEPPAPRPRRSNTKSGATIIRDSNKGPDKHQPSLRLTVKMPSSRLREATSAHDVSRESPAPSAGARSTRNKPRKSYVMESESEDAGDDGDEEGEEDEDDLEVEEDEVEMSDANSEDPDVDADGDIDMDDDADDGLPLGALPASAPRPQPSLPTTTSLKIKGPAAPTTPAHKKAAATKQPTVTVTPVRPVSQPKLKSVEDKEMSMANAGDEDEDEELSELGSSDDGAGEEDEEEEEEAEDDELGDEDAEGDEDDDEELDDSRSPEPLGSRASTPDVSKMTKRQRSRLDQVMGTDFLQLPMEPQIKKHLTAEEHAMRRAEMARRRKNLSEKRNEEEKADTINRLLKKQAPKRRGKISQAEIAAQDREDDAEDSGIEDEEEGGVEVRREHEPADPVFVRWVSDGAGCRVGVPAEWLGKGVGRVFEGGGGGRDGGEEDGGGGVRVRQASRGDE